MDQRGRDQFMIRYLDDTEIFYNDAQRSLPESVYKRNCWTDMFVQWSPQGSFVATVHAQGVAIWGGVSFQRLMRFSHPKVSLWVCVFLFFAVVLLGEGVRMRECWPRLPFWHCVSDQSAIKSP